MRGSLVPAGQYVPAGHGIGDCGLEPEPEPEPSPDVFKLYIVVTGQLNPPGHLDKREFV